MSAWPGYGLEIRQRVERQVHLAGRAAILVAIHVFQKFRGQCARLKKFRKGQPGIDARRNDVGINLVAVGQHHAFGFAVLHDDLRDGGLGADFGAKSRAASAIAFEIAPVPPRANPQERKAPSISPM